MVLNQYADKAFERAQDGAVEHHRAMLGPVFADIGGIKPFRQHIIKLQRAALPRPSNRIRQVEFKLGRIESAFARQFLPAIFRYVATGEDRKSTRLNSNP